MLIVEFWILVLRVTLYPLDFSLVQLCSDNSYVMLPAITTVQTLFSCMTFSFSTFLLFCLFLLFYQLLPEYLNTTTTTTTTTTVVLGGVVVGVPGYSCCIKVSLLTTGMELVLALISLEMLDGCASDAN